MIEMKPKENLILERDCRDYDCYRLYLGCCPFLGSIWCPITIEALDRIENSEEYQKWLRISDVPKTIEREMKIKYGLEETKTS